MQTTEQLEQTIAGLRAWYARKPIQVWSSLRNEWDDVRDLDTITIAISELLRPKPSPKLRPWKPEEVPVGALAVHRQSNNGRFIIQDATTQDTRTLCNSWLWRWPHEPESANRPCGVMEDGV